MPGAKHKQLTRTLYAAYRRACLHQQTRRGQRMRRVCQGTVEPVFGNLLPHYSLRRMNVRGLAEPTKLCCSRPWPTTSKSGSSTTPTGHGAWPWPCPSPYPCWRSIGATVGDAGAWKH